jgi:uncharacterized protein YndB with AHSA1/START domain
MMDLPFAVDREIVISATRATVFRYFTDPQRWARWWGQGSTIDPRPGGAVRICYPGNTTASGTVVEIVPPERIVFTYGYDRADPPIAPGASRVTITVTEVPGGTRVQLRHDVATEQLRDEHRGGWRYQMGVFGDVVTSEQHAGAEALIDRYLAAWSERDPAARRAALAATCSDDVVYRDRYGFTAGRDDLDGHIAAAQVHLPSSLARAGAARLSQGQAIIDWQATKGDAVAARGTTVLDLAPDGRIARATGFWS